MAGASVGVRCQFSVMTTVVGEFSGRFKEGVRYKLSDNRCCRNEWLESGKMAAIRWVDRTSVGGGLENKTNSVISYGQTVQTTTQHSVATCLRPMTW